MLDRDAWLEVVDVLRSHKVRTTLTAFGVLWGIAMLVIMLGFGNGLRVGVNRSMAGLVRNSIFVWTRVTSKPHAGFSAGRRIRLVNEDVEPLAEIPEIATVCPRAQLGGHRSGTQVTRGDKSSPYQVMGDVPAILALRPVAVTAGRFLNPFDIEHSRKVVVIGRSVARELFRPDEDPIGAQLTINLVPYAVVGVVASQQTGDAADRDDSVVHIPLTTFQRAFGWGNQLGYLSVLLEDGASAEAVIDSIRRVLAAQHRFSPGDENAVGSWDATKGYDRIQRLFTGIEGLVWFVGLMTLLSGVVGVSNIMLVSVKERTREIGVRRALGASPGAIVGMVLQEALVLTGLAGMFGIALGVAGLEIMARFVGEDTDMFSAPFVSFSTVLIATAVLGVSGLLAGLLPARVALNQSTVEAIRV